jgi:hypothetical protein
MRVLQHRYSCSGILAGVTLFLILVCTLPVTGLTLVYIERTRSETLEHTINIEPSGEGHSVVITSRRAGSTTLIQSFETDGEFAVVSWVYRDLETGTTIFGTRRDSTIMLSGRYRGKTFVRQHTVEDKPWYQLFPLGLERLAVGKQQEVQFYVIGFEGITAMRIGNFRAERKGVEAVEVNGKLVPSVFVRVSLSGLASILWSGDYWLRAKDGRPLVARSDRGPGTQSNVIELIAEY